MRKTPKTLHIKTFGCQMNVYDSERMAEALAPAGYTPAATPEAADLVILNTCHIREKAAEKVYSELGRLKRIKFARRRQGHKTVIAVAGCVAQAEGAEIVARAPVVDLVVGPQSYHRLPELLAAVGRGRAGLVATDFPEDDKFGHLPARATARRHPCAFLTVQEGCDKFCTFCVVPYTRGVEYSRPVAEILAEAERLVAAGVRELTLLGQNVNAYHGAGPDGANWPLARLLARLHDIEGLERLRYTTSHPRDMNPDLIAAHRDLPKLMPYLHLPFQAGSDRILAAMNRKHTRTDYLRLIERIRAARPDLALSTDIIVGFPGETDQEFEETLALVQEVAFAHAYSFKYSARPGTPAANMAEQVADGVKAERLARLQALLEDQKDAFNAACVGAVLPVLFERAGRRPGQLVGRSPYLQAVHADGPESLIGRVAEVAIVAAKPNSLEGAIKWGQNRVRGPSRTHELSEGQQPGKDVPLTNRPEPARTKALETQSPVQSTDARVVVPFEDNRLLAELLGQFDSHLAMLEDRLGIEAVAHGNMVTLRGPTESCATARAVLQGLYARLARGESIEPGDVDGAIRHADAAPSAVAEPDGIGAKLPDVPQIRTRKRVITARTPVQSAYLAMLETQELVFSTGPAGTGKTYLAVAYAAACLERGAVDRIILSRPAVEAGERLGFLPGDMREKVDPYLRPLYDALYDVLAPEKVERGLETGVIEIAPLAFMRGRTLSNAIVILDEAQNCTAVQMKMFLTRLGENSKMIVTGDPTQVDLPPGQCSGLEPAIDLLRHIPGIAHVAFTRADVVRRELVSKIVAAYEQSR